MASSIHWVIKNESVYDDPYYIHTKGQSNGGRSLKDEHLALYKQERAENNDEEMAA